MQLPCRTASSWQGSEAPLTVRACHFASECESGVRQECDMCGVNSTFTTTETGKVPDLVAKEGLTGSPGAEPPPVKKALWSFGSIRKPFLETLKKTDKSCHEAWYCCGRRKGPMVPGPVSAGIQAMRRFSKGELVSTDPAEMDLMLDNSEQDKHRRASPRWRGLVALLAACVFSILGSCIMWSTDAFDDFVTRQMILDESKMTFSWWATPPIAPWFKVYIWNYTNIDEYMQNPGIKLKLEQVGPYTYRETLHRYDVHFNDDGTMTYKERKTYQYSPERSKGDLNATVFVPNLPYIGAVAKMNSAFVSLGLNLLLKGLQSQPFISVNAHDLIWGYDDRLFSLSKLNIIAERIPYDKFGLLSAKQFPDTLSVYTGATDLGKLGYIDRFNGKKMLNAWTLPSCNTLEGSDGSLFPPRKVARREHLFAYKPEACRLIEFEFNETSMAQGVRANRYIILPHTFMSPRKHPENLCFCNKTDLRQCPPDGIFNTAPCAFGAPVMISYPHFYRTDPVAREPFEGMNPNHEDHDMFADIHPRLGMTLQGRSRLQLNIQVQRHYSHSHLNMFPDGMVLPIAWFSQDLPSYETGFKIFLIVISYTLDVLEIVLLYVLPLVALVTAGFILRRLAQMAARRSRASRLGSYINAEDIHHGMKDDFNSLNARSMA